MQLHERLKDLVGHEVIIATQIESEDKDVPPGTLKEVGLDYLIIKTEEEEKGGFAVTGAQWFISLPSVISIIHFADCKKCAVEAAGRSES